VDFSQIGALSRALALFLPIYRRFRRKFSQQPLRPVRMRGRVALLPMSGCLRRGKTSASLPTRVSLSSLAKRDQHRIGDEQKCDHQGAVAPSRYHFNHDHSSTSIAAQLYICTEKNCMPQVSKSAKLPLFAALCSKQSRHDSPRYQSAPYRARDGYSSVAR
jgi:hypothetical protein